MQNLAGIFAREPVAALGQAQDSSEDPFGLRNDPLDVLGLGSGELMDRGELQEAVAQLNAEVQQDTRTATALQAKQHTLTNLQAELQTANAQYQAQKQATAAKIMVWRRQKMASASGAQIAQINRQVKKLLAQVQGLKTERSQLTNMTGNATTSGESSSELSSPPPSPWSSSERSG